MSSVDTTRICVGDEASEWNGENFRAAHNLLVKKVLSAFKIAIAFAHRINVKEEMGEHKFDWESTGRNRAIKSKAVRVLYLLRNCRNLKGCWKVLS